MSEQNEKLNESIQYLILRLEEVSEMIRKNKSSKNKEAVDDLPFFSDPPSQTLRLDFLERDLRRTKRAMVAMSAMMFFLISISSFLAFYILAY